ncbi:MAG: hypothetical protein ACLTJG_22000, partial [[Clostridium] innocuum]
STAFYTGAEGLPEKVEELPVFQRNPYLRTRAARLALQNVSGSMQHCLDAQLVFLASVSRLQLCDEAALKGVHGASQILYDFQDEVLRQEILHQLLLREKTVQNRLLQFMTVSERLLDKVMKQEI